MVGRTLAHFRVEEKVGAGRMGEVHRTLDTRLGRQVALKVLPAAVANDETRVNRLAREARLLASLNHPNIAAIHRLEEADGVRFLVLERVGGETLAERIGRGRVSVVGAESVTLDPLEMLARLCQHLPSPGQGRGRPQSTASRTP